MISFQRVKMGCRHMYTYFLIWKFDGWICNLTSVFVLQQTWKDRKVFAWFLEKKH